MYFFLQIYTITIAYRFLYNDIYTDMSVFWVDWENLHNYLLLCK